MLTRSPFSFAHSVWGVHHHDDAFVVCRLQGEVCEDPTSRLFLMGPDFVGFRSALEARIAAELTGRLLYHAGTDDVIDPEDVMDASSGARVQTVLLPTRWPVRPTVEMLGALVAVWADETAEQAGVVLAAIEIWESARSGLMLDRDGITAAHGVVERWFRTTTPSADSDVAGAVAA